jgi:peptide/nickel transport system ATP-binding protein
VTEPLIRATDIVVTYPGSPPVTAVDGVSFDLYPGEVVGLVGESGCGKSTMARVLTGLIKPNGGEVLYQGEPLRPLGLRARRAADTGIQMVFQDPGSSLNPRRRVGPQIQDGLDTARLRGAQPTLATPELWLERIGMEAADVRRFPRNLSGGQRQRIAAARALAAHPNLLIGDEPISALDASTQASVAYVMTQMAQEQGTALLFISHDLSIVRLIADRLIVMYRGHVVERGPTDEVWSDPKHPYTRALLGAIPAPDGEGRLPLATDPGTEYPVEEAVR